MRGYLPLDREFFLGSLIGARDREFGVGRLKPIFLKNSRSARDPPARFAIDEQIAMYFGSKSGLKKRMPKKTGEGIEYFTVATSNKYYEGYQGETRKPSNDGKPGKLVRAADPVCGGYKFNYLMDGGRRYQVGTTATSKSFGILMLLIFGCGTYLRYSNSCLITDSAYGFIEGVAILSLWEISWVTSLRIALRRGFLGIKESLEIKSSEDRGFQSHVKK